MSQQTQRSTFVTTVAWIFIVLAGFATLISILQNIMVNLVFPMEEMNEAMSGAGSRDVPVILRFLLSNIGLVFFCFLVISATTFVSAIGLLKRKNWARILFMILLCLGIAWSIFGVVAQFTMFPSPPDLPDLEGAAQFNMIFNIMKGFTFLMAVGIGVLFAWIIRKLASPGIRGEFQAMVPVGARAESGREE